MSGTDGLIQRLNRVQDLFTSLRYDPIALPKIVVVGSQSSGKSSVLESLVSRSFLPRGIGIVTRCPLVLQLISCPKVSRYRKRFGESEALDEWGEFLHAEGKIFSMDQICQEIMDQQNVLAGSNKGICDSAITLKIYSHVVDLTLVDLPGITKVPVEDQPLDIEEQILKLVRKYIENPMCIILAIVTANTDMATNESLKLAREVDPHGLRTLAVVTKLDLMDQGTDAYDVLSGKVIPVKRGIVGVVNRSQKDIKTGKPLDDAQKDEMIFFQTNYPDLADQNGTPYLRQALHVLLLNHIRQSLPGMLKKIESEISKCQLIIGQCGTAVIDKKRHLLNIISTFAFNFRSLIEGGPTSMHSLKLVGGAKLCDILESQLTADFETIDPIKAYSLEQVLLMLKNSKGMRPAFLMSECAFEGLLKPQIKRLLGPSLNCLDKVQRELLNICQDSIQTESIKRFPRLRQELATQVKKEIEERIPKTKEIIGDMIDIQMSHVSYRRLNFLKDEIIPTIAENLNGIGVDELAFKLSDKPLDYDVKIAREGPTGRMKLKEGDCWFSITVEEGKQVKLIGIMLQKYFKLVIDTVQDNVSKGIMRFLVNEVKDTLQSKLYHDIYSEETLDDLFIEKEDIARDRKAASDKLKALQEASRHLNDFIDGYN